MHTIFQYFGESFGISLWNFLTHRPNSKGAKDEVKQVQRPPTRSRDPKLLVFYTLNISHHRNATGSPVQLQSHSEDSSRHSSQTGDRPEKANLNTDVLGHACRELHWYCWSVSANRCNHQNFHYSLSIDQSHILITDIHELDVCHHGNKDINFNGNPECHLSKEKSSEISTKAPAPDTDFGGVHIWEQLSQLPVKVKVGLESESWARKWNLGNWHLIPDYIQSITDLNTSKLPAKKFCN